MSYNPNFNFHGYDLSCHMLTIANGGGGNSNFACTMTKRFRADKGAYDETTLLCKSREVNLYEYLSEVSNGEIKGTEDLSYLPQMNDPGSKEQRYFIFDDLLTEVDKNPLISEYSTGGCKNNYLLFS